MVQKKVVRDTSIDIARGIGIILMVLGHVAMPHNSVIFRFHMALFFIISGWCFSDKNIADVKSVVGFAVRKIKTLYLPYVLFNIVGCLLHNFFIRINIYTDNVLFLDASSIGGGNAYGLTTMLSSAEIKQNIVNILKFEGNIQLAGAAWFLKVMFGVSILWCLINWLLKTVVHFEEKERLFINAVISVFLMLVSWKWMKSDTHFKMQFETVASSYIMFATGYYWKKVF